jgi:signal transduction histidine kinase
MHMLLPVCSSRAWLCLGLILGRMAVAQGAGQEPTSQTFPQLTNVPQLQQFASLKSAAACHVRLEGNVWWANSSEGKLVLQDVSGVTELEMDLTGQPVEAGQRIRLEGDGVITKLGDGFKIGIKGPTVDNNGVHTMIEKSGSVYLKAGRQPIRVDWFNGLEEYGLEVDYEGPGLARQKIPDAALFRIQMDAATGTSNLVNGLDYKCCEVAGEVLPDFNQSEIIKTGATANFDLDVLPRKTQIGLEFDGFLEVPRDGLYTFYTKSDDGSQLFVGEPSLKIEKIGNAEFPAPRPVTLGQILPDDEDCQWAQIEGTVTFASMETNGMKLELTSGTGRIDLEIANNSGLSPNILLNSRIQATGVCQSAFTADGQRIAGTLLVSGAKEIQLLETNREVAENLKTNSKNLPTLTTAAQVHQLKREEAQRGYPVKICGVVTCVLPEHQAFTIQDSTRGLYAVDLSENQPLPQIGEFLEIAGATDPSLFAPIVNARQLNVLGAGNLPEPVRPTWDQLMNGSLDAQYVELQGIVIAVNTNGLTLLTRDGRIKMELRVTGSKPETLARYEDALVRVRGCLFASWDYVTHEVKAGEIRIYGADISVDEAAPKDLFAIPQKTAAELLLFDPRASVFQRVKVAGQILCERDGEFFMTDGKNGLRFILKKPADLAAGDLVEVVGFPELSGASPVLREAMARKTGSAPLPPPKFLEDDLIRVDYDARRVRVNGVLAGVRGTPAEKILEIQNGVRTFLARLNGVNNFNESLPVGSKLELTGVYAAQGGNKAIGQNISSFELLLNSPADIKVLARPPWWTLERLLIIVGALAFVLVLTGLWITQLHRKVEERTLELETQIRERQFAEQQRAMERERARVAQDLHDELGSGLTEISMLAAVAGSTSDNGKSLQLEEIDSRARQMVTALDEIVWAMNPKHDSLASLVSYCCLYADRFLKLANINCRLKGVVNMPERTMNSVHRHELFLAFKEALTNVVRHSCATEVRLGVQLIGDRLRLSIADNGGGLGDGTSKQGSDGLINMRTRVEKMGGRFEITSKPDRGTTLRFYAPLN